LRREIAIKRFGFFAMLQTLLELARVRVYPFNLLSSDGNLLRGMAINADDRVSGDGKLGMPNSPQWPSTGGDSVAFQFKIVFETLIVDRVVYCLGGNRSVAPVLYGDGSGTFAVSASGCAFDSN
jgi:hypothetical protein